MNLTKIFLVLLIFSSNLALAADSFDLSPHGPDLMKAAFPVRYKFQKMYGREWTKTSYDERQAFLTQWYQEEAHDQEAARLQAKTEATIERNKQKVKQEQDKKLQKAVKADLKQKKEEQKAILREKREFESAIKEQQQKMKHVGSKSH